MQKITPFLWFDKNAEDAANFYVSVFGDSRIKTVMRYGEAGPGRKGAVMSVTFQIEGQEFIGLNGGNDFSFSPAISFFVYCATQQEIDTYWSRLCEGGKTLQCGWVTDKFGVTWQIVPTRLMQMLQDPDPQKSKRVMQAMMTMVKLDIGVLEAAYAQGA
jgi:predicted 3-demethylubiquinone-9 3-methyltransferase (glyoxalase superfamily)